MLDWKWFLGLGAVLLASDIVFNLSEFTSSLVGRIPAAALAVVAVLAVVAAALEVVFVKTNGPFVFLASFGLFTPTAGHLILEHPRWLSLGGFEVVLALIAAILVWVLSIWILSAIIFSVSSVDVQKQNLERVDDPYGDKHAARILESDAAQEPDT